MLSCLTYFAFYCVPYKSITLDKLVVLTNCFVISGKPVSGNKGRLNPTRNKMIRKLILLFFLVIKRLMSKPRYFYCCTVKIMLYSSS